METTEIKKTVIKTYQGLTKLQHKVKFAKSNSFKCVHKPPFYTIGGNGTKQNPGTKCNPPKSFKAGRLNIIANSLQD
mgnify:CR=1 FL=1